MIKFNKVKIRKNKYYLVLRAGCFFIVASLLSTGCTGNKVKEIKTNKTYVGQVWYKQEDTPQMFTLLMETPTKGWAVSSGRYEKNGALFSFDGKEWKRKVDFPYSVYPTLLRYDENTLWLFLHETYTGKDRPRHYSIKNWVWSEIPIPPIMFDSTLFARLKGVDLLDDGTAWMAGSQGNLLFFDRNEWKRVKSPVQRKDSDQNLYSGDLTSIDMVDADFGFAVGIEGIIIKFQNGKWEKVDSPIDAKLNSVCTVDRSEGWAVGLEGTIIHYKNGAWEIYPHKISTNLKKVKFANKNLGWIVGLNFTLLEYSGGEWREISIKS